MHPRVVALLLLGAVLVHAWVMVRDLSGPLVAAGDANYFEYLGYFVRDHLRFAPLPTLDFVTDEVGFPFGTSIVYLSWCAERDLLHALLLTVAGPGPWLQLYVMASDVVSAMGIFWLLRREVGAPRAALVAFAGTVMAFYAAFKFPIHLNMAALHWASMSITLDWILVRRVVRGERLSGLQVLLRVALLGLTVGLDIAYVAGYALVSFTVSLLFVLGWLARRARRRGGASSLLGTIAEVLPSAADVRRELRRRPLAFAWWTTLLLVACALYVPFDFAVVRGSRVHAFDDAGGNFWASQFRLLLPYLPGVHPGSALVQRVFGDADAVGEFSVGWALLVAAVMGLRDARRTRSLSAWIPLLVTFALCFAFHPTRFRTLHLFPWFMFNRVAGRATIFFPLFAALMALGVRDGERSPRARRGVALVAALGLVEIGVAYGSVHTYAPFRPDASFDRYMAAVRARPGKGVFDWPFCIAGANGVGTEELCPYYTREATTYSYRRFHGKSVPGFYLSRLHPAQIAPWLAAGFPSLFSPDVRDAHRAQHETRCWDDAQFAEVERFYRAHDFGGVQLYADLAPGCVDPFHRRYGPPLAETVLPGVGRVLLFAGVSRPSTPAP